MTAPTNYTAIYSYDAADHAWNVHVSGLPGCQTYGKSIRQAQRRIREAVALWLDVEPERVNLRDRFPAELTAVAAEVARARGAAERAGERAQAQTADAVRMLTSLGLSRRDAGDLLGLSHQRVHQLLEAG